MANDFGQNPYATPEGAASTDSIPMGVGQYGGIRRLPYFGYGFLAGILFNVISAGAGALAANESTAILGMVVLVVAVIGYIAALLYIVSQRLVNIGSSPWWCLGALVPLLNIFIGVRCLVCPEGYDHHKTLDGPAKVMLGIAITVILLAVLAVVFAGMA